MGIGGGGGSGESVEIIKVKDVLALTSERTSSGLSMQTKTAALKGDEELVSLLYNPPFCSWMPS